jgi:hypothetical protein
MEIEEARLKRRELERRITEELKAFQYATRFIIDGIEVTSNLEIDGNGKVVTVSVKTRLGY